MSRIRLPALFAAAALLISACGAPSATALAPTGSAGPSPAPSAAGTPSASLASRGPGSSVAASPGTGSPVPTRSATPPVSPRATRTPASPAPTARRSPAPSASAVAAKIVDFAFTPAVLTVTVGTTVTWTNTGQVDHTVTANAGAFDSGILAPGARFSFRFTKAGTFAYHCAIHPFMTGTVVVRG